MKRFFDSNILIYAFSDDFRRPKAQLVLADGGVISAQTLNEFANVLRKKHKVGWPEIENAVALVRSRFSQVQPLTAETTGLALKIARDDGLSFYDALIVAAALETNCDQLISEDMQHGRRFGPLEIFNPFIN